jgi:hypothetical protein
LPGNPRLRKNESQAAFTVSFRRRNLSWCANVRRSTSRHSHLDPRPRLEFGTVLLLLRIETNPRGASVVFFFEGDYSVNVETTTGQEAEVARRCGGLIPSPDDEIVIAPADPGIAAVNM